MPYVTWALMAINIVVFLAYYPALSSDGAKLASFWSDWALVPQETLSGVDLYTLVTSMFLHGGWMHLAGNMLYLWIFGDNMEDALGHGQFLLFYLAAGLAASGLQIASDPDSLVPVVGASGAIAGVLGGYLLLYPRAKIDVLFIFIVFFKIWPIRAWIVLLVWFGLQVFNGAAAFGSTGGGVAYWAHAGGFIAGLLMVLPAWTRRGAREFWRKTEGHPPYPETQYQERLTSVPVVRRRR